MPDTAAELALRGKQQPREDRERLVDELLHEVEYYSSARAGTGLRVQAAIEAAIDRAARHALGGTPSPSGTQSVLVS